MRAVSRGTDPEPEFGAAALKGLVHAVSQDYAAAREVIVEHVRWLLAELESPQHRR